MSRLGCALLLCVCLTGCTGIRQTFNGDIYRVDRPWYDSRTNRLEPGDEASIQLDLASYCFPDQRVSSTNIAPVQRNARGTPAALQCQDGVLAFDLAVKSAAARDSLQDTLLELSNQECAKHKAAVFGTNTGANLLMSTLASLLAGGATGFAAQSTKTALAAGSTFVIASQSHFNEQVYRQMFVGSIVKAIDDDRTAMLAQIYDKRRFPVPAAAIDPRVDGGIVGEDRGSSRDRTRRAVRVAEKADPRGSGGKADGGVATPEATGHATMLDAAATTAGPQEQAAPRGSGQRLAYSIEEAIRDAEDYHDRCSFYNGLVRVAAAVEAFSPCDMLQQRRERIFAELEAMRAASTFNSTSIERFASLSAELKQLDTKLDVCSHAAATAR